MFNSESGKKRRINFDVTMGTMREKEIVRGILTLVKESPLGYTGPYNIICQLGKLSWCSLENI